MRALRVGVVALVVVGLWALPRLDAGATTVAVVEGQIVVERAPANDGHYADDTVTFPRLTAVGHITYGTSTYDGAFALDGVQYEYLELIYCGTLAVNACFPGVGYPLVGHAPHAPETAAISGPIPVVALDASSEREAGTCGGGSSYATSAQPSSITLVLECSLQLDPLQPAQPATVTIDVAEVHGVYVVGTLTAS